VILLELERLYNHVADFGAIANDTGFAVAHATVTGFGSGCFA
jgi:Ni,Fe-hydrogenase III large subunit